MDTLYHYCSNATFLSIVGNKSIWLSSLLLSNDSMEGKLASEAVNELAKADNLTNDQIKKLQDVTVTLENSFDGLGFCLSEEGDLLSQWRGYTENGAGISIGFSTEYLEKLSQLQESSETFKLKKIRYETNEQIDALRPTYESMKKIVKKKEFKKISPMTILTSQNDVELKAKRTMQSGLYRDLLFTAFSLTPELFVLKSSAFKEEREWRLISSFSAYGEGSVSFKSNQDRIVPYRQYELKKLAVNSITHVILGPLNKTPHDVIKNLLNKNGFPDVIVKNSEATYLG